MRVLGTYHGASTIMRKDLDWNLSRISMLEVEAVPPELYVIGLDRLEYGFVEEKFVVGGELGISSDQPMHFGEGKAE
jgi:hypothetical protein